MTSHAPPIPTSLLAPGYRLATIGMTSLIFLAAFEELAVTTIMPTVSAALDGRALFSAAFSATLAASVVGMVAAGLWADRSGPAKPLLASVLVFVVGLLVAGLAPSMEVFVAARFLQGLGSGGLIVALYVMVAAIFAPVDHPQIFGAFAAAWVVPSMVGPPVAGVVAQALSWRWVFLGVVLLAAAATATILPSLRSVTGPASSAARAGGAGRRLALSVLVAAAVVLLDLSSRSWGRLAVGLAAAAVVVVALGLRPLLPPGTLVARRGLPAVIAQRGLISGTFFAADIYLPYLLQEHYDVPVWLSGVTLTLSALGWAGASHVQGRLGVRLAHRTALRVGAVLLLAGVVVELVSAGLHLSPVLVAAGWVLAGAGMGLQYPRIGSLVLAASSSGGQGRNSAAMTIADAVGGSAAIALAGLVFAALGGAAHRSSFAAALGLSTVLAVLAVLVALRHEKDDRTR